jgi:hypothetical protein
MYTLKADVGVWMAIYRGSSSLPTLIFFRLCPSFTSVRMAPVGEGGDDMCSELLL